MENPQFWWYLPGKVGIFMGYVSFREGILLVCLWARLPCYLNLTEIIGSNSPKRYGCGDPNCWICCLEYYWPLNWWSQKVPKYWVRSIVFEEFAWFREFDDAWSGSTISTLLHDRINPKDCQVLSLGDTGFLQFFRVVSRDDKANPVDGMHDIICLQILDS